MNNEYRVELEVAGSFALFANPTCGPQPVSYPTPPYSAAKGMFESILFLRHAQVIPVKVNICSPTKFVKFGFNCTSSHKRKYDQIRGGTALQVRCLALCDVIFQLFARVENLETDHINHAHSYQEQFNRRLRKWQSFRRVCLGRSDFPALYVGPIRKVNQPDVTVNHHLPTFLHHPFSSDQFGHSVSARFDQNVVIQNGVLEYA